MASWSARPYRQPALRPNIRRGNITRSNRFADVPSPAGTRAAANSGPSAATLNRYRVERMQTCKPRTRHVQRAVSVASHCRAAGASSDWRAVRVSSSCCRYTGGCKQRAVGSNHEPLSRRANADSQAIAEPAALQAAAEPLALRATGEPSGLPATAELATQQTHEAALQEASQPSPRQPSDVRRASSVASHWRAASASSDSRAVRVPND